jgi:hypothetical protein
MAKHAVKVPAACQMLDQRIGLELGKDLDLENTGVDEIIQDKIDNAVFSAEIDRRFGPFMRERVQSGTLAPGHDHAENVRVTEW